MQLKELPDNFDQLTPEQLIAFTQEKMADQIDAWEDVAEWFLSAYGSNYLIETKDGPMVPSWGIAAFRSNLSLTILELCRG
jgi:hypothetical protein